jgi:hypothetical protein
LRCLAQRGARGLLALLLAWLPPAPGAARPFALGELRGQLDLTLGHGLLLRVEDSDSELVGIGNGGSAESVNGDDGNQNYEKGVAANQLRGSAELTLAWRNFGAFVRAAGFYDFENELGERARTELDGDALWEVGAGAELQDAYLAARFDLYGMPLYLRAGRQVVNWGESGFLRFGVDVVNPLDLTALAQPAATAADVFKRQGMLWAAAVLTETLALEAFYQYDWEPAGLPPLGSFLSADDLVGDDGAHAAFEGFGRFSDLGTDLDAAFGLPAGTLGFDPDFMKIPSLGRQSPDDQGQFGFTLQAFLPQLNASKLALHFASYHSRLPIVNGRTADAAAVAGTSDAAVDARAAELSAATGLPPAQTRPIAETVTVGEFANEARSFVSYPENLRMLGLSFNTATLQTGTLVSAELSHHFDWPVQLPREQVIVATLSPILFTDAFAETPLGRFGPAQEVRGDVESGKTQLSLGLAQLLGRRLGAAQSLLAFDVGWVHLHDLPATHPADADSWGYRLIAQLTYDGLLGGVTLRPQLLFAHDVGGTTPGPLGAFLEDRKLLIPTLSFQYRQTWTADLSYSRSFGAAARDPLHDRDFVRLNLIYHY